MDSAQDFFNSGMELAEKRKRSNLTDRMMILWRECAEEYRVLPFKYLFFLKERKAKKLSANALHHWRIDEYPEIPFFRIMGEEEARAWLDALDTSQLEYQLNQLEFLLSCNHSYRSVKAWVADTVYTLTHKKPCNPLIR